MPVVRRGPGRSLRALIVVIGLAVPALPLRADDAVPIALHLIPGTYVTSESLVHLVTIDINKTLKAMAAGRAEDKTVLEDRAIVLTVQAAGAVSEIETNTRRYGGNSKDTDTKERTNSYQGTIAPDGVRTPPQPVLEDAGDGALDQLPDIPLAPGQQWTFTRPIKTDRDLGQGTMTYTDKVVRVDDRAGHKIATIEVTGVGRIDPASDLAAHGFKTAEMKFGGTAEFDTTAGLPGVQHYTGKVTWTTVVMMQHIPVTFNDAYDATPLVPRPPKT